MRYEWPDLYDRKLLFAVGVPLTALGIVVATAILRVYGPDWVVGNAGGRGVLQLAGSVGYALAIFTQLRYFNIVVFSAPLP